jgi:CxxC motif-containing protein (DUF1111 family)
MCMTTWLGRVFFGAAGNPRGGALGVSAVMLSAALFMGVQARDLASGHPGAARDRAADGAQEAPGGFDNKTNGFEDQAAFDKDRKTFEEVEAIDDGLGPVYNATSCVGCHQNPVSGSGSQVVEIRAGRRKPDAHDPSPRKVKFEESPGGSVIHQRAIDPAIQEYVLPEDRVRTFRLSTNILGNGFVEVIPDERILEIRREQSRHGMQGFAVVVPVAVEMKPGTDGVPAPVLVERIGRFGWKCQEASLLNFSSGAYLVEMGITNPLQPKESLSNGRDVSKFDKVPDPEDKLVDPDDPQKKVHPFGADVEAFTRFLRSTGVPPRDASVAVEDDVRKGEALFHETLGCAICHYPSYTTPLAGTPIQTLDQKPGSDLAAVPDALGNKVIHPYSDFLLHDVGTGDGIAQTQHADLPPRGIENLRKIPADIKTREGILRIDASPGQGSRRVLEEEPGLDQRTVNMIRTAPLWGLRARPQLMHDGLSLTIDDAIRRHRGQAEGVRLKYVELSQAQKDQLIAFLKSL